MWVFHTKSFSISLWIPNGCLYNLTPFWHLTSWSGYRSLSLRAQLHKTDPTSDTRKKVPGWSSLVVKWLRIQRHYCGTGLILGPGTSACLRCNWKKKSQIPGCHQYFWPTSNKSRVPCSPPQVWWFVRTALRTQESTLITMTNFVMKDTPQEQPIGRDA